MSEKFTVGQTVWKESSGKDFRVLAVDGDWVGVKNDDGYRNWFPASWLTATDPRAPAEPVPQKCPFCMGKSVVHEGRSGGICLVRCAVCAFCGPIRPTRLDAIQAWDRITLRRTEEEIMANVESRIKPTAPEPTPKLCPRCGREPITHMFVGDKVYVYCDGGTGKDSMSCISGPICATLLEAVQSWDSIWVETTTISAESVMNPPVSVISLVRDAVAEEREACAKIVEEELRGAQLNSANESSLHWHRKAIRRIRNRGQA